MKKYPMLLTPVSKEIIWGGNRLKSEYGKKAPFENIAESWELTVRDDGMNTIANGEYSGMPLDEYIGLDKKSILGDNCEKYDRFPLLIKFIDAKDNLSVQVHPDNEYAIKNESEFGKTEMWYIMDAEPGSQLVYGLKNGCSIDAFAAAIQEDKVEDSLNYVEVKKGDVYFIPAGQVHAIGAGILIAEIQQNSNITYRVYDYKRRQKDGSLRQLHTKKALDVIKIRSESEIDSLRFSSESPKSGEALCSCDYFTSTKYVVSPEKALEIISDDNSFQSVLVLDSDSAKLTADTAAISINRGDSLFIPAGLGKVEISGSAEIIVTYIN